MNKKDTRADIISVGTDMISRHGYGATGIDAVLKGAGVPKGSFYHYFSSKEDFGLAVIDRFADRFGRKLDSCLADEELPPLERIRSYLEKAAERFSRDGCEKGCLIGNLGQELADVNERFRSRIDSIMESWRAAFAACLRAAQETGEVSTRHDPELLAGFLLSGWEGAILRAKVTKSARPMEEFRETLLQLLRPSRTEGR
jgi:TetR/AcrR family transcriptional repressor of nem operon